MNPNLRMVLVLTVITAVAAGLLGAVNSWTGPIIEENTGIRLQQTLARVIDADEFESEHKEADLELWLATKDGKHVGYVVDITRGAYSPAGIRVLVGIDTAGTVTGTRIFSHSETPGLGDKVEGSAFLAQFAGKNYESPIAAGTDVDSISGATASSMSVIGSVRAAIQFVALYAGLVDPAGEIDFAQIPDGVYTGSGQGFAAPITVEVTIADGSLKDVKIISEGDTPGYKEPALKNIPKAMVEQQLVDVDIVSGATGTSNGIISAVRDALAEFVGGEIDIPALASGRYLGSSEYNGGTVAVEVFVMDGSISSILVLEHKDSDPDYAPILAAILEAQSLSVDVSGEYAEALLKAVETALRSSVQVDIPGLADGVYVGEADSFGHEGKLRVEVTVADGAIATIKIIEHHDTKDVADPAFEIVIERIVAAQDLDVDTVSYATISSEALLKAVKQALLGLPKLEIGKVPDGTFAGQAMGFYEDIHVSVVVAGGKITDIVITKENDTPEIARPAFNIMIDRIKDAQSLEVDTVSEATISAKGLLEAIENALRSAND